MIALSCQYRSIRGSNSISRSEVPVTDQPGQFHPGADLLGRGVVGQVPRRGPALSVCRTGLQALEYLGQEVLDHLPALGRRHPGQLLRHGPLLIAGRALHHDGHRGTVQLQDADLRLKRVPVGGGNLGDARLARQHPAHVGQAEAQWPARRWKERPVVLHAASLLAPAGGESTRTGRQLLTAEEPLPPTCTTPARSRESKSAAWHTALTWPTSRPEVSRSGGAGAPPPKRPTSC